ncbi:hypothetical protein L6452_06969 [Arctium lappa]|uniref:Uncharacterized protein n=1 Tax=Arctium lappa TaxID=4217 RepID=A0ACB9EKR4_ARCLA|nr:hypothetical protein L6452_06969 [Arctium lappa]
MSALGHEQIVLFWKPSEGKQKRPILYDTCGFTYESSVLQEWWLCKELKCADQLQLLWGSIQQIMMHASVDVWSICKASSCCMHHFSRAELKVDIIRSFGCAPSRFGYPTISNAMADLEQAQA